MTTNILLVDGNDEDRSYYAHRLKTCSPEYVVFEAKDGESGLRLYKSERVDCILTEFDLPDMSGFQLLYDIVAADSHPPVAVIMLARVVLPAIAELAKSHGAQACLIKRLTADEEMETLIQQALSVVGQAQKDSREKAEC